MKKQGKQNTNSKDFRTVWKVDAGGASADSEIRFHTQGSFTVDWGDGYTEQVNIEQVKGGGKYNELKHTYVKKGEYTVSISSGVTAFWINQDTAEKLIEIKQWGAAQWKNMYRMFCGAGNMVCTATDAPDLSKVKNMHYMFYGCHKFNSPIEHWDTKDVKYMGSMLSGARMFNRSLAKMDLRNVVDTFHMLNDTPAFDQDLRDLNMGAEGDTGDLFGYDNSLADYNEEHAERFDVQDEKQNVYSVLKI